MRRSLRPLAFLIALLLAVPAAHAQRSWDYEETIEERFAVQPGEVLTVRADLGAIVVEGDGGREVVVRVVKGSDESRSEAEALFARYDVRFERTRSGVEITGTYDRPGGMRWGRNNLGVRYEIRVPRAYNVDLVTAGGSISVDDLAGDVKVRTSGGSLAFEGIEGFIEGRTSGGSISATRVGGRADLHTSGGSITVRGVDADADLHTSGGSINVQDARGEVTARTSGGSIRLDGVGGVVDAHTSGGSITASLTAHPTGPMSLKTSGGSVTLEMPSDARVDVDARASGGRVRTDFAVRGTTERSSLQGAIGGGGPLLTLRSSGGSVTIRSR